MSVGAKIGTGFGLALAILVGLGGVSYRSTSTLIENNHLLEHTHRVLQKLRNVLSLLKDAETGNRGYIITGEYAYLEPYHAAIRAIKQEYTDLRELTQNSPNQKRRLDRLEPLISERLSLLKKGIDSRTAGGFQAGLQIIRTGKGKQTMTDIRQVVGEMESEENQLLAQRSQQARTSADKTITTIQYGIPLALVLLTLTGLFLTHHIATPLKAVSNGAGRIAAGDLTVELPATRRRDEIGVLTQTFRQMTDSLRNVNREITEGVNLLSSSVSEISASTTQLASSSAQAATAISETTTTVEEVRQTAQVSNQKSGQVAETAQIATRTSQEGKKFTEETSEGIQRIRHQMESIAQSMVSLSEQSQAISDIIATVDDLAQQSNLLAVNASIEAAKAGEQGKGFAVVAQEVKILADQSKQATMRVRTILNDIQKATGAAVMATEQGSKAVEAGVARSAQAGESILTLADSVAEAAQAGTQIAASSQQQLIGMDQIALAMESVKQSSAQNVESARQLETAAHNLNELGHRLKELVGQYKL